jgi:murein DD-endopeptidase MepM/ murein hydrolase activator NlpD
VLPTANRALFEPGGGPRFYVGTVGKTWAAGAFGCTRSDGWQMHEGLDIRSLERDSKGESIDPILAVADGTVKYVNRSAGRSNYGLYAILEHQIEGVRLYSLYAHLSSFVSGLKPGQAVRAGDRIGTMGRTANTRQGISRERAHLHLELAVMVTDRFEVWHRQYYAGQKNYHGVWHGINFLAIDAGRLFLDQERQGNNFSLQRFLQSQPVLFRVLVRDSDFPFLRHNPGLVSPPTPGLSGRVAGYELHLNYNGVPIKAIPRGADAFPSNARVRLLEVNAAEYRRNPCRKLVRQRGKWELTNSGSRLLEMLLF